MDSAFRPDFLVIGARRCGTTWLHEVMKTVSGIALSRKVKETRFFSSEFHRGVEWYRRFFGEIGPGQLVGEVDPNILKLGHPEQILSVNPHMRIIALFRDPATQFYSSYLYAQKEGEISQDRSAEDVWSTEDYFRQEVSYADRFERFLDAFPREHILIIRYERMKGCPEEVLTEIFRFLGVTPDYDPAIVTRRVNPSRSSRAPWLTRPVIATVHSAREHRWHWVVRFGKRLRLNRLLESLMRPERSDQLSPALRARIFADLQADLDRFEGLTGLRWEP